MKREKELLFFIDKSLRCGITLKNDKGDEWVIAGPCANPEALEQEVHRLCTLMERTLQDVKAAWTRENDRREGEAREMSPVQLWEAMKTLSPAERIALFNGQEEHIRKRVAQYVFEHTNVFSGMVCRTIQPADRFSRTVTHPTTWQQGAGLSQEHREPGMLRDFPIQR